MLYYAISTAKVLIDLKKVSLLDLFDLPPMREIFTNFCHKGTNTLRNKKIEAI